MSPLLLPLLRAILRARGVSSDRIPAALDELEVTLLERFGAAMPSTPFRILSAVLRAATEIVDAILPDSVGISDAFRPSDSPFPVMEDRPAPRRQSLPDAPPQPADY